MPRRIPDYPDAFAGWNLISSFGSIVSVVATGLFGYIIYDILANGQPTENNAFLVPPFFQSTPDFYMESDPSTTLEWSVISPTPYHAFLTLPIQSKEEESSEITTLIK